MEANGAQATNESGPECKWIGNRAVRRVANPIDCVPAMWHSMTANYCQGNDVLRSIAMVTQYSFLPLHPPADRAKQMSHTRSTFYTPINAQGHLFILIVINKHKQTSALTPPCYHEYATLRKISKLSSWINLFYMTWVQKVCRC